MSEALRKLFVLLAAQLPLVSGMALKWQEIQQHPLMAFLLCVSYEVLLVLVAFGKKVWEELEKDVIKVTADWVRAAIHTFKPGFSVARDVGLVFPDKRNATGYRHRQEGRPELYRLNAHFF